MGFKLWGYAAKSRSLREPQRMALTEVTLVASPAQLRKIAKFIEAAADGIENRGSSWEHEHLADTMPGFRNSPSFIVFNKQREKT